MNKIITLFKRNYEGDRRVFNEVTPGAEWVIAGEGIATIKIDGTCCLVRDGKLYKRYDAKKGKQPPAGFEPAEESPDPVTGHWPGWIPVGNGPEDQWHREAWDAQAGRFFDGTYELIGPKIQGNPHGRPNHMLFDHSSPLLVIDIDYEPKRDFNSIREWLFEHNDTEGIVWHHPDGRMVKIKRRDFGLSWGRKQSNV